MKAATLFLIVGVPVATTFFSAQQPTPPQAPHQASGVSPYVPKQSDRPEPVRGDEPGFEPIFDGKTLAGWEGDPRYWRVEDGALVGEINGQVMSVVVDDDVPNRRVDGFIGVQVHVGPPMKVQYRQIRLKQWS